MKITWTNCADAMPPDEAVIIVRDNEIPNKVHKYTGFRLAIYLSCYVDRWQQIKMKKRTEYTRFTEEKWEALIQMSQQCGNCKWWDKENKVFHPPKNYASD